MLVSLEMLGGKCVRCGATEDLEFDHIDPSAKSFGVCAGLAKAWDVLVEEAAKCQLLCKPWSCDQERRGPPWSLPTAPITSTGTWNCRCNPCKAANAAKSAALAAKKQRR